MDLCTDFCIDFKHYYLRAQLRSCRINLTYSISVRFNFDVSGCMEYLGLVGIFTLVDRFMQLVSNNDQMNSW